MASAMRYWVEEFGVDGYRADVAGFVPLDFWVAVRQELEQVKPVFMLAEFEGRDFMPRLSMQPMAGPGAVQCMT